MLSDKEPLPFQSYPPLKKKREDLYETVYVNQKTAVLV